MFDLDLGEPNVGTPERLTSVYQKGDTFDPSRIGWVMTHEVLGRLVDAIYRAEAIAFDLETTGLDEHATRDGEWGVSARVSMASITVSDPLLDGRDATYVVPLSHPEGPFCGTWTAVLAVLAEALLKTKAPLIAHNGKFDVRWVTAHTGIDLSSRLTWDTQVIAHLQNENSSTRLKVRAGERFGVDRWDDFDLSTPGASEQVPMIDLGIYAARDTYWTWRLYEAERTDLYAAPDSDEEPPVTDEEYQDYRLGQFAQTVTMPTVRTLTKVEQRGMAVDPMWIDWEIGRMEEQRDETKEDLAARYNHEHWLGDDPATGEPRVPGLDDAERRALTSGDPSFAPTSKWFTGWAQIAVEAGELRVDSMTPRGRPQWSRHVLTKQARQGSDVAQVLLDHRHAVKRLEFLQSWKTMITPAGRLHANYNVGRVVTGRLSSSNPNMQQVTKTLKPAFIPTEGYVLAEIDYSQIELRAAAFVARCEPMIEAYQRGDDLHRLMAARLTEKDPEDVTPTERQQAKAANFGLLYLQSPEGFQTYAETAYGVTLTIDEAARTHALFFEQWPGMREWQMKMVVIAEREGQVISPLGRIRRLPNIWSGNPHLQSDAQRQAVNSPVQSFASDLMQISAASIAGEYGHEPVPDVYVVGTVHDSLVVEVPRDDWRRACARVMKRMLNPHPVIEKLGCRLDVPLAAEATVGTRWGLSDVGTIIG